MPAPDIIRAKRDGGTLDAAAIDDFVRGLVDQSWSEAQVAAMAMAIFLNGMSQAETVHLTRAMTHSGEVLDWGAADLGGPVLDKHSTGGVGDKVSLLLAPIVAACGGYVPMISGRGLGHTGGTLDKFDSIPGYQTTPSTARLAQALRHAGCAVVGQTTKLAPADRRLYAIRDVTATVESIPLITASILSKKLAAGLDGLAMDVKCGNGAFARDLPSARTLAASIASVAQGAGLATTTWITDMDEVLGTSAGLAVEVVEVLDFLQGGPRDARLLEVTRILSAELLCLGRLADDVEDALTRVDAVLGDGRALERFARMVAALGGPVDFVERAAAYLPVAPVRRVVPAPRAGWIGAMQTRALGMLVVDLGGGRLRQDAVVDHRVGVSALRSIGTRVEQGAPLGIIHAASEGDAARAADRLLSLLDLVDEPCSVRPVLIERITAPPPSASSSPLHEDPV